MHAWDPSHDIASSWLPEAPDARPTPTGPEPGPAPHPGLDHLWDADPALEPDEDDDTLAPAGAAPAQPLPDEEPWLFPDDEPGLEPEDELEELPEDALQTIH